MNEREWEVLIELKKDAIHHAQRFSLGVFLICLKLMYVNRSRN